MYITEVRFPVQGATIFGTGDESHGVAVTPSPISPHAVAQAIAATARADVEDFRTRVLPTLKQQGPWTPPPPSAPRAFRIYNRWTGKYVRDVHGNETADDVLALEFSDQAAADLFIQQSQGTAIAYARQQSPPDDPPSCATCWRPQVRATVVCPHCSTTLTQPTGWVHTFPLY